MYSQPTSGPLDVDVESQHRQALAGRRGRRITLGLAAVFLIAALLGVFGHRTATVSFSSPIYKLDLTHPQAMRSGTLSQLTITVSRADGKPITSTVSIEIPSDYLDGYQVRNVIPQPDAGARSVDTTVWSYEAPHTEFMEVRLELEALPGTYWRREGFTAIKVDGQLIGQLLYQTWVLP